MGPNDPPPLSSRLFIGHDDSSGQTDVTKHVLFRIGRDGKTEKISEIEAAGIPEIERLIVEHNRANEQYAARREYEAFWKHAMYGVAGIMSRPFGLSQGHAGCAAAELIVKNGMAPVGGYVKQDKGGLRREADNPRVSRNARCSCGCGKKIKRCPNLRKS